MLAIAAAAGLVPALLLAATAGGHVHIGPIAHLVIVGVAGALAAVAATALSLVAARVNDSRAVMLGTAFSVMATMLVVHALSTPGVWVDEGEGGLMRLTGALNIPVGAVILLASAVPALRRVHPKELVVVQAGLLVALLVWAAVALAEAADIPEVPEPTGVVARVIFAIGAAALGLLAWRAGRTYLLTRRVSDLLVTIGLVWLIGAQYGLLRWYEMDDTAWWVAHGIEVAGIALIGIPAALDLRYGIASRPLLGDLRPTELVADEEAFLGSRVRALMLRLADKDPSTEGHTRRVAALAVEIGERLGLPERRLRLLAVGGLLHDMGKLSVPDDILKKPARLDESEYALIRRHPAWGRELLAELGGFSPLVLRLVESHHERLDARGYPNHQPAGALELEVRILAVADVYDALTDERIYRPAWTSSEAFELLDSDAGQAFDSTCVRALHDVLARSATRNSAV